MKVTYAQIAERERFGIILIHVTLCLVGWEAGKGIKEAQVKGIFLPLYPGLDGLL